MATKPKAQTAQEEQPKRDTSKRPALKKETKQAFDDLKKRAQDRVFFSFVEGDQVVVQILSREEIPTENGPSPRYKALYQTGNIHGTGAGAPPKEGETFFFWSSTVLESLIRENDVRNGDSVAIAALGPREGRNRTYYDFAVEVLTRGTGMPLIGAGATPVAQLEAQNHD